MALYLPTLSRALQKAKDIRDKEGMHQMYIGKVADGANSPNAPASRPTRADCRAAYRQDMGEAIVTELLYVVHDEAEFAAYWNTMIRRDATDPLEYTDRGHLVAKDALGNTHYLAPVDLAHNTSQLFPMAWVFISTNLAETSAGNIGSNVLYSDGHGIYVRYPGEYPMTRFVAELSHRFMVES
jgi:hypothetical protein